MTVRYDECAPIIMLSKCSPSHSYQCPHTLFEKVNRDLHVGPPNMPRHIVSHIHTKDALIAKSCSRQDDHSRLRTSFTVNITGKYELVGVLFRTAEGRHYSSMERDTAGQWWHCNGTGTMKLRGAQYLTCLLYTSPSPRD